MTTDREAAEWVARTYPADAHPTVAALAAAYLRVLRRVDEAEAYDPNLVVSTGSHHRTPVVPTADVRAALDLTRRGCPGCGALIPNDMARCALCGWPTEVTP